jgi:hypothetical protein
VSEKSLGTQFGRETSQRNRPAAGRFRPGTLSAVAPMNTVGICL